MKQIILTETEREVKNRIQLALNKAYWWNALNTVYPATDLRDNFRFINGGGRGIIDKLNTNPFLKKPLSHDVPLEWFLVVSPSVRIYYKSISTLLGIHTLPQRGNELYSK